MSENKEITILKSGGEEWGSGSAQYIDFIITEDCNLRCKYCYICHKQTGHTMPLETAKKFIDYLFSGAVTQMPAVVVSFIGGEPFIETDLMDQIMDYFKMKSYISGSDWCWNYRISVTTNGVNYSSTTVQKFIKKNADKISVSITIDGTKEKHDLQRVFPNGSGSYDIIEKSIPLYISQFPATTKVTFAHDDLPLLKESIIHLWKMGINDVNANVVYEDAWEVGDDIIFENQLKSLADYIIENQMYENNFVSLFDPLIGRPFDEERLRRTVCGAGVMLALGPNGKVYPCLRYKDYSINSDKAEVAIGSVDEGIDFNKVLRFRVSNCQIQCDEECLNCDVAIGCSFCQGQSYDAADTPTNFQRSKYICKMHKARVRASRYYYNRLLNEKHTKVEGMRLTPKRMYFPLADDFVSYCEMENPNTAIWEEMGPDVVEKGLEYCYENFYYPVFVHSFNNPDLSIGDKYTDHRITHIVSARHYSETKKLNDIILVFDKDTIDIPVAYQSYVILNVNWEDVSNLYAYTAKLFKITGRINLNLYGLHTESQLEVYEQELRKITDFLIESWNKNIMYEFSKITDVYFSKKQDSCNIGEKSLTIMPNGDFAICPLDYLYNSKPIGNIYNKSVLVPNQKLYSLDKAPLCVSCPATHCNRCAIRNNIDTGEVNVPSFSKCMPSMIEYKISKDFQNHFGKALGINLRTLTEYEFENPYEAFLEATDNRFGYTIV